MDKDYFIVGALFTLILFLVIILLFGVGTMAGEDEICSKIKEAIEYEVVSEESQKLI